MSQLTEPVTPEGTGTATSSPPSARARLRRGALTLAARLAPKRTAKLLARRYLSSSHGFLDELAHRKHAFDILRLAPDLALLRHAAPTADAPRVLVVPGHDGHYRQFTRLLRSLKQAGFGVDLLVLPGHMHRGEGLCSMRDMTHAVLRATDAQGPYHGMIAHCVTANATLFALDQGLHCPRVALISAPLNLRRLVRQGGALYGLEGRGLDAFVEAVDGLGAPFGITTPWEPAAKARHEPLLMVHARGDYAAPLEDVEHLAQLAPGAALSVFDNSGHNAILNNKAAIARVTDFLRES